MPQFRVPVATYRLQLGPGFQFRDAQELAAYLNDLGITDIYVSPIFKVRTGSSHGYDVTDPTRLNPELGQEKEFASLARELSDLDMGLLLDIVPNHMAVSPENPYWMDVLKNGVHSPYAAYFDIDWTNSEGDIPEKVLLPVLNEPYGRALEEQKISLIQEEDEVFVSYMDNRLPVSQESLGLILDSRREIRAGINGVKGDPRSFDRLEKIMNRQHYRLAYWKTGVGDLNYRRFFNITSLIGVRVELPEVMERTHRLVLRLAREGMITGLRIDHIDGLYDPASYLEKLRAELGRFYVVVEKILSGNETLPVGWYCCGTTGYDFAREVNNVFIDRRGIPKLVAHYSEETGENIDFTEAAYRKKKQVLESMFYAEVNSLGCRLDGLAKQDRYACDLAKQDIIRALIEVTARLPVYRTYNRDFEVSNADRQYLEETLEEARRNREVEGLALDFLRRVFLLEIPSELSEEQRQCWMHLVMKWQQFTGAAAAKGLEDTALYTYNRLVSLNVIGTGLKQEHDEDSFHHFNINRLTNWPLTLNTTSTHDTKRSEDVQARIDVLSEMARPWTVHLSWWKRWNYIKMQVVDGIRVPDPETEELLYQTLAGSWPLSDEGVPSYRERFKQYMLKAVREAKVYSDWNSPDSQYEKALLSFIDDILEESEQNEFLDEFLHFQKQIAFFGALNSLSQVILKIGSPGVPDFYQGTELWDFSLVDPDNRRPVDYSLRKKYLGELLEKEKVDRLTLVRDILDHWQDGKVKMYLTCKALKFRRSNPLLFQTGEYIPLGARGRKPECVMSFGRHLEGEWAVAAVTRFTTRLVQSGEFPLGKHTWKDSILILPEGAPLRWRNVITGEELDLSLTPGEMPLAGVFKELPVALLTGSSRVD